MYCEWVFRVEAKRDVNLLAKVAGFGCCLCAEKAVACIMSEMAYRDLSYTSAELHGRGLLLACNNQSFMN